MVLFHARPAQASGPGGYNERVEPIRYTADPLEDGGRVSGQFDSGLVHVPRLGNRMMSCITF